MNTDLNQIVTFATAFNSCRAALVGFTSQRDAPVPRPVPVGKISARAFCWVASTEVRPQDSASLLSKDIVDWLGGAAVAAVT